MESTSSLPVLTVLESRCHDPELTTVHVLDIGHELRWASNCIVGLLGVCVLQCIGELGSGFGSGLTSARDVFGWECRSWKATNVTGVSFWQALASGNEPNDESAGYGEIR